MAYQSQTYSNGGHAYYITNENPVIPTDPTAIQTPLELLGVGGAGAAYYTRILQTDANGLAIIEASTIQGPLMGITLNPNGTNGPVANAGPQIYAGFTSTQPNILLTSSLTEVFGTLAIGTRLDQTDVNALKIGYSATPYPNSLITQTSGGSNQLQVSLQAPLIGTPAVVIANPANATQTTTITGNSVTVKDTGFLQPSASLSFLGGQAAVIAKTGTAVTQILTDSGGGSALEATNSLGLIVNYDSVNQKNVLVGNTDGTTNIPLKMYGPEVSTIVTTTSTIKSNYSATVRDTITNKNGSSSPDYISGYNNYQGQLLYNTLRNNYANPDPAPVTAFESLEIVNVSGGPQTGGIQFYTSNNSAPTAPKWMGGFLQNNVGPTSEFRLASTVQASMSQITNLSTINNIALRDFGVPTGSMFAWCPYVPTPPTGYLICDGGQYPQAGQYATLYAVIGTTYSYGAVNPGYFRVPNMIGRAAYGSVFDQSNVTPMASRVNVTAVGTVVVGTNTNNGGGSSENVTGLYCTAADGPLYKGMITFTVPGNTMQIDAILYDQTTTGAFVLLPKAIPSFPTNFQPPYGNLQFFFDDFNAPATKNAPYIGNNNQDFSATPGLGNTYYGMRKDEIAPTNVGTVATSSTGNAGAGNQRSEPNFSTPINTGIYSYTPPGGSFQSASAGIRYIPANTATWWIIKY
jgi:hypothetical protein